MSSLIVKKSTKKSPQNLIMGILQTRYAYLKIPKATKHCYSIFKYLLGSNLFFP